MNIIPEYNKIISSLNYICSNPISVILLMNAINIQISELCLIVRFIKKFNLRLTFAQSSLNLYSIYTQRSLNSFFFRFLSFSRARPPPEPYNVKRIFQLLSNS